MQIERGIPFPGDPAVHIGTRRTLDRHDSAGQKYPFRDLFAGDCFVVHSEEERNRAIAAARNYRCTAHGGHGRKQFASRKVPAGYGLPLGGIGIWRVT